MFALVLRLAVSLTVVIGLMVLLAAFMKKRGLVAGGVPAGRRGGTPIAIDVVGRRALGRQAQVAVVRTAGRLLVLGVTDQHVTILTETAADECADIEVLDTANPGSQRTGSPTAAANRPGPAWKTMLDSMRDRTVRR